jgi:fibronectin type 3 domain-containing protein
MNHTTFLKKITRLGLLLWGVAFALRADVNILIIGSDTPGDQQYAARLSGSPAATPAFQYEAVADHLREILEGADHGTVNVTTRNRVAGSTSTSSFVTACNNLTTWFYWPYGEWVDNDPVLGSYTSVTGTDEVRRAELRGDNGTEWDYVVLIGDPFTIETIPGYYTLGVARIAEEVAKGTAETVLLMPWPAAGSSSDLNHYKEVVYRTGRTAGVPVAPAGLAWEAAGSPTGETHPSADGAYIAAATLYSRLFGQSAANSSYNPQPSLAATAHTTVTNNQGASQYSGPFEFNNPFKMLGDKRRHHYNSNRGTSTENRIRRHLNDDTLADLRITRSHSGATYNSNTPNDDGLGWPADWPPTAYNWGRHRASAGDGSTKSYFTNRDFWQLGFGFAYQATSDPNVYLGQMATRDLSLAYLMKEGTTSFTSYNLNAYDRQEEIASARLIPFHTLWGMIFREFPDQTNRPDNTHLNRALGKSGTTFMATLYSGRTPVQDTPEASIYVANPGLNHFAQRVGYETAWIVGNVQARAPGFKVTPSSSASDVASETFSVRFLFPPREDVTVHIGVSDPTRAEVSHETLVFTAFNYDIPREVSSRALNRSSVLAGSYEVVFSTSSDDEVFDGLDDSWSFEMPANAAPSIDITAPSEGQNFPVGSDLTVSLNSADPDGSVAGVTLWINDTLVRQINSAPYQWSPAGGDSLLAELGEDVYKLKVTSVDNQGASYTLTRTITVGAPESTAPPAPGNLGATPSFSLVTLAWDAGSQGQFASYSIYRSTVSDVFDEPIVTGLKTNGFSDADVENGTTYFYVVTATDIFGNESLYSNEVEVVPALPGKVLLDLNFGSDNDGFAGFTPVTGVTEAVWTEQADSIRLSGAPDRNRSSLLREFPLDTSDGNIYSFAGVIDAIDGGRGGRGNRIGLQLFSPAQTGNTSLDASGIHVGLGEVDGFSMYILPGIMAAAGGTTKAWDGKELNGGLFTYEATVEFVGATVEVSFTLTDSDGATDTVTATLALSALNLGSRFGVASHDRSADTSPFNYEVHSFKINDLNKPVAPTGLTAYPESGFVTLSWDAAGDPVPASYRIYRREGSGPFPAMPLFPGILDTPFQDGTVNDGTIYGYAVSAVDDDGIESDLSEPVEVTFFPNENPPGVHAGADQAVVMTGVAEWNPADIAGLVGWYDASDAASITASGGAVSQWVDKSGNALHLTQSETAQRPTTGTTAINGTNALKFDGADDLMTTSGNPFGASVDDAFVMAVHRVDATASGQTLFSLTGSDTSASRWQSHAPWNTLIYLDTGGTSAPNRISTDYGVSVGEAVLVGFYGSTTDNMQQIFKNGSLLIGDASGHSVDTAGNIFVGGSGGSHYQNTAIGEFIILNDTVSTEDRQKLEGYLAQKWGLAGTLPPTHPYRTEAPVAAGTMATLDGTASDPDGNVLTTAWSLVSGPAPVTFSDPADAGTTVVFTEPGVYVLRLTASDGLYTTVDEVTITVDTDTNNSGIPDSWEADNVAPGDTDGIHTDSGVPYYFLYLSGWTSGEPVEGAGQLQIATPSGAASPFIAWEFTQGFEPGVHFEIGYSTDLKTWHEAVEGSEYTLETSPGSQPDRIRYELEVSESLGDNVFIRLQKP